MSRSNVSSLKASSRFCSLSARSSSKLESLLNAIKVKLNDLHHVQVHSYPNSRDRIY